MLERVQREVTLLHCVGMYIDTTSMENNMDAPQKIKNRTAI